METVYGLPAQTVFLGHKKDLDSSKPPDLNAFLSWYARCLQRCVRRTENSSLSCLLSVSEIARFLSVVFLLMAATSVFGQEKVRTLAMVRYSQSPLQALPATRVGPTAIPFQNVPAPRLQYRPAALTPGNQNDAGLEFESRLEKQNGSNQRELFQLVHKKIGASGRTGSWVDVEAGYGQTGHDEYGFVRSTADLERPGFAYLRADFSF